MDTSIIYKHDYLKEICERLTAKAEILNISNLAEQAGVPRSVVANFAKGKIPTTSFENVVKLYKFLTENKI